MSLFSFVNQQLCSIVETCCSPTITFNCIQAVTSKFISTISDKCKYYNTCCLSNRGGLCTGLCSNSETSAYMVYMHDKRCIHCECFLHVLTTIIHNLFCSFKIIIITTKTTTATTATTIISMTTTRTTQHNSKNNNDPNNGDCFQIWVVVVVAIIETTTPTTIIIANQQPNMYLHH